MSATEVTPADTLPIHAVLAGGAADQRRLLRCLQSPRRSADHGATVAQTDGDPLPDLLRRPTSTWDDPNRDAISPPFALPLTDVPPGTYQLVSGFYRRDTGERLLSPQGEDSLMVATIEVR
ncbi:MAG: hypothetical protein U0521_10410 [Anaerolineae bacterium]